MIIALTGSHRSGKTSLARAYAEKHNMQFLETSASAVFKEMGLDPAGRLTLEQRLDVQEAILKRFVEIYKSADLKRGAITDRCPLDLMAYTLADAAGDAVPEHLQERFEKYIEDCRAVLHDYFAVAILVQPGIPLVAADGKAFLSKAYIEMLNTIFLGLLADGRTKTPAYHISRTRTSMDSRIAMVEAAYDRVTGQAVNDLTEHRAAGRTSN